MSAAMNLISLVLACCDQRLLTTESSWRRNNDPSHGCYGFDLSFGNYLGDTLIVNIQKAIEAMAHRNS